MEATLLTFDAALWGAFAFGAFLATLGYCTAYVMNFQKFSVGNVDVSSGSVRVRRWLLIITALTSVAKPQGLASERFHCSIQLLGPRPGSAPGGGMAGGGDHGATGKYSVSLISSITT
jgi:hypothetical protein